LQDMLSERLDVKIDTPVLSLPQVRAGNMKAYAVTSKSRLKAAPEIPTTDEAGLPGFYFSFWHAIWAPKGTPKDVIAKLNDAVVKTLDDPVYQKKLDDLSQDIFPREQQTPEALGTYQKSEIEKWWPIIKAANIRAQ
jgi:tripartite-type tricarboxylate transporter receptor subunit TctC